MEVWDWNNSNTFYSSKRVKRRKVKTYLFLYTLHYKQNSPLDLAWESDCLALTHGSSTYQFCDLGQVVYPSEPQFPYLPQANDTHTHFQSAARIQCDNMHQTIEGLLVHKRYSVHKSCCLFCLPSLC